MELHYFFVSAINIESVYKLYTARIYKIYNYSAFKCQKIFLQPSENERRKHENHFSEIKNNLLQITLIFSGRSTKT